MDRYIRIITFLGLFILLSIQFVWLCNSYTFVRNEIAMKAGDILENAINEETFSRLNALPRGTMVAGRPESERGKNIPEFAYMQESLIELGVPMSLDTIARIYKRILGEEMMPVEFSLSIWGNSKVVEQTGKITSSKLNIKTNQIPIRKDLSFTIQATLSNPQRLFFQKMGVLLISTTILVILVFACVIYLDIITSHLSLPPVGAGLAPAPNRVRLLSRVYQLSKFIIIENRREQSFLSKSLSGEVTSLRLNYVSL